MPELHSVAWGDNGFVAVSHWDTLLHSRDGEVWQEATHRPDVYGLNAVTWDGQRYLAVGHTFAYSEDGKRWSRATSDDGSGLHAVTWSGERYVAVGHDGLIMHSDDGEGWSQATYRATTETLNDVAWNGERFVAVGFHGAIVHSADGDRWQPASRPAVPFREAQPDDDPHQIYYYFGGVAWNGERFVAVGWGGNDQPRRGSAQR